MSGLAVGLAGVCLLVWPDVRAGAAGALVYLILVGAIAGFTAYAYALKHLPVATVSLYAYVNPVIAVLLGTVILKEPFGARVLAGAGVVFTGVALVKGRGGRSGDSGGS